MLLSNDLMLAADSWKFSGEARMDYVGTKLQHMIKIELYVWLVLSYGYEAVFISKTQVNMHKLTLKTFWSYRFKDKSTWWSKYFD